MSQKRNTAPLFKKKGEGSQEKDREEVNNSLALFMPVGIVSVGSSNYNPLKDVSEAQVDNFVFRQSFQILEGRETDWREWFWPSIFSTGFWLLVSLLLIFSGNNSPEPRFKEDVVYVSLKHWDPDPSRKVEIEVMEKRRIKEKGEKKLINIPQNAIVVPENMEVLPLPLPPPPSEEEKREIEKKIEVAKRSYLVVVDGEIRRQWKPPYVGNDGATVIVGFTIKTDGSIDLVKIIESSGDEVFDKTVLETFLYVDTSQFSPFPEGIQEGINLKMRFAVGE